VYASFLGFCCQRKFAAVMEIHGRRRHSLHGTLDDDDDDDMVPPKQSP